MSCLYGEGELASCKGENVGINILNKPEFGAIWKTSTLFSKAGKSQEIYAGLYFFSFKLVPGERIELSWVTPHDFESCASTNSATRACNIKYYIAHLFSNFVFVL